MNQTRLFLTAVDKSCSSFPIWLINCERKSTLNVDDPSKTWKTLYEYGKEIKVALLKNENGKRVWTEMKSAGLVRSSSVDSNPSRRKEDLTAAKHKTLEKRGRSAHFMCTEEVRSTEAWDSLIFWFIFTPDKLFIQWVSLRKSNASVSSFSSWKHSLSNCEISN